MQLNQVSYWTAIATYMSEAIAKYGYSIHMQPDSYSVYQLSGTISSLNPFCLYMYVHTYSLSLQSWLQFLANQLAKQVALAGLGELAA